MQKLIKKVNKATKNFSVSSKQATMTKEQMQEKISVLRMEMTHYAVESVSISILALLLFIGAPSVFPEIINPYLPSSLKIMQALVAVPSVFWVLTLLGNVYRLFMISKLQKQVLLKK